MVRTCDICGKEENEQLMQSINTGRKTEWWCWECYKNAQYHANKSDHHRQQRLYKIHQSTKRHR